MTCARCSIIVQTSVLIYLLLCIPFCSNDLNYIKLLGLLGIKGMDIGREAVSLYAIGR